MIDTTLIILIAAILADLVVPVMLGAKYPGYRSSQDTISALGAKESPVSMLQNINLGAVGALFLAFAAGQGDAFGGMGWWHGLYVSGIGLFGVGCIMAGIFPADSKGAMPSVSGKVHGITSGVGFLFLALNPLWAIFIDAFEACKTANALFFLAGVVTLILFVVSEKRERGLLKYTGVFQRLNLVVLYGSLLLNFTQMLERA